MKSNYKKFKIIALEWLETKKFNIKETTYSQYQINLLKYIYPYIGNIKIKDITTKILLNYIDLLMQNNISNRTIKEQLLLINQILKYNSIFITIPKIKVNYKKIRIISEQERIILEKYIVNDIKPYKLGIILSLYCGLRIGEVCALKWKDIDLINNKINISKTMARIKDGDSSKTKIIITTAKTKYSNRTIPIPNSLIQIFLQCKGKDENYVLTNSLNFIEPRTYSNKFKSILKKLNLSDYNYHALRHTFASLCVELGFDIKSLSEIMGHSSIKTTLQLYVHINEKIKISNMNKIIINY